MHQLMTLDAIVVAKVTILAVVGGSDGGAFDKFCPPRPSIIIKAMTLGIHATLSYLHTKLS